MKAAFVNTLAPNELITTHFLVAYKEIRQKKTGEPYLTLLLADRTGEIEAKMWDNVAEVMNTFDRDDFVKVKGLAQIYQNKPQFTVHKIRRSEDHEVEAGDYFPCSKRDAAEMAVELRGVIASIKNDYLRNLIGEIFSDPVTAALYHRAPAAKTIHHACLGGLIEHVLSLCGLCRMAAAHYPDVDLDLLLTTAILHDIGKIQELSFERSFSYTTPGQLLGHIVIGLQMINDAARKIAGFPPKLKMLLEHMILSHHGELEFGSPKVPVFSEALLFHHLDNLDSKFEAMRAAIDRDRHPGSEFTGWVSALERVVLKKEMFLHAEVAPPAPAEPMPPHAADDDFHVDHAPRPEPSIHPVSRPAPTSPFGEKLKAVLGSVEVKS